MQHSLTDRLGSIEGWGVSLAEAAASGLSVVGSNHGGIQHQVVHGRTRFLVGEGDVKAMAESMLMLAGDPALRLRMGRAGRENIEKVGNLSLQIEKLRRVLEEASGRRSAT